MTQTTQKKAVHLNNAGMDIPLSQRRPFRAKNEIQQLISQTEHKLDKRVEAFTESYIKGDYDQKTEDWPFLFLTLRHAFTDAAKNYIKGANAISLKEHIKENTAPLQEIFTSTVLYKLNIQQEQDKVLLFNRAIKESIGMMDYIYSGTAHNIRKDDQHLLKEALESVVFEMEHPGTIRENREELEKALITTAKALGEDYNPQLLRLWRGTQDLNEQEHRLKKALEHAAGTLKLRIATTADSGSHIFLNTIESASIPIPTQ